MISNQTPLIREIKDIKPVKNDYFKCSYCGLDNRQIVYRDWCKIYTLKMCYPCAMEIMPNVEEIKGLIICESCGNRFLPIKPEHQICWKCWKRSLN